MGRHAVPDAQNCTEGGALERKRISLHRLVPFYRKFLHLQAAGAAAALEGRGPFQAVCSPKDDKMRLGRPTR